MPKNNTPESIEYLIDTFLNGSISEEEFSILRQKALENDEGSIHIRHRIKAGLSGANAQKNLFVDTQKAYERFIRRRKVGTALVRSRHRLLVRWSSVAAAVVMAIGLLYSTYQVGSKSVIKEFSDFVLQVPQGSQIDITLPDGTKAKLNSGSRITYSQGFGINERTIELEGEGFFDVKHRDDIPFIVNTKEIKLVDIGTKFYVSDYTEERELLVCLTEGRLNLINKVLNGNNSTMNQMEKLVLNKSTGELTKEIIKEDPAEYENLEILFFDELTLTDIARKLSRFYGATVRLDGDSDNNCLQGRFYGYFNRREHTLEQVLEMLAMTKQVNWKKVDNVYLLF